MTETTTTTYTPLAAPKNYLVFFGFNESDMTPEVECAARVRDQPILRHIMSTLAAVAFLAAPAFAQSGPQAVEKKLPDWVDYIDSLKPIGDRVIAKTWHSTAPQSRQETWRMMMATLAQGALAEVYADPDYPEFISTYNTALNLAAPNPDYMYSAALLRGDGVYRIRGFRGTNRYSELQLQSGFYALGISGPALDKLDLASLKTGPDGAFDVILSQKRPEGYAGDWWRLDPRAISVVLRQASYDWVKERDASVTIARLDVPAPRPRLSAADLSARLAQLASWTEKGTATWYDHMNDLRKQGIINRVQVSNLTNFGGAIGQTYLEGTYNIGDGEALILETDVPQQCRYWSFLITDDQYATVDWMNRQSSLNGFQAHLDADGKFRAVIAVKDPQVPNWLDTGGYRDGVIQVRWNNCTSGPIPTARKVPLAEVRKYLPNDTPIVTAAQRDETLRNRRFGAQLRRRW